jgi:RNA polymerase sigma factor (sigma-70 family)
MPASPAFATTRWSLVTAAGGPRTEASRQALESLCRTYWYPLYALARREGAGPETAQDLVQGFFQQLLEREALDAADPARGRFRSFLRASFRNYARSEHAREAAAKRGGGRPLLSLDVGEAEGRFRLEPAHEHTPERQFERDWAVSLLERALARVRAGYAARGQESVFEALKPHLVRGGADGTYAAAGAALGLAEGAVKVAVHRLRERYRRALREEVADTMDGDDVEDEIRALFAALGARPA